jgi:hypothetical protein
VTYVLPRSNPEVRDGQSQEDHDLRNKTKSRVEVRPLRKGEEGGIPKRGTGRTRATEQEEQEEVQKETNSGRGGTLEGKVVSLQFPRIPLQHLLLLKVPSIE